MEINMKGYNLESFQEKDLYSWEEIIGVIEDLESDKHSLKEQLEDLEQNVADNYKPVTKAEQNGFNERDFI